MDNLTFIASLVSSLAWPVTVLVLALVFRRQIVQLLDKGLKRLKLGPVELEWSEVATNARVALATAPELKTIAPSSSLTIRLGLLAESQPSAAIAEAWVAVEKALRERLGDMNIANQPSIDGTMLVRFALERRLVSEATVQAVDGLAALRNLAVHGQAGELDKEKALDYLTLADATLYAIKTWKPGG